MMPLRLALEVVVLLGATVGAPAILMARVEVFLREAVTTGIRTRDHCGPSGESYRLGCSLKGTIRFYRHFSVV
jgi:hypothetical protein